MGRAEAHDQLLRRQHRDAEGRDDSGQIVGELADPRRPGHRPGQAVHSSKTRDLTKLVNDNCTWFLDEPADNCAAPPGLYDVEGDGKGAITRELLGSPLIHG